MNNNIVFASNNAGKIAELQILLEPFNAKIVSQKELNVPEIPETGLTFVENALIKARHACKMTHLPAIADDSGLHVNALNGAPGIYSARYAGEKATSENNIKKLLSELETVPPEKRQAHFYCVLVYMRHAKDPTPLICEGRWHGLILQKPTGNSGFGYDPIFWDPTINAGAAQISIAEKNQRSHRGHALKLLMEKLKKDFI